MKKILIIGQAPTDQKQTVPYDTTMLYQWLEEVGINKDKAQELFDFEAVSNKFPGKSENGHNKPSEKDKQNHWKNTLELKVQTANKVWLLGNVAKEFFYEQPKTWSCNLEILETIHPSRRNFENYRNNKTKIINKIKTFLYGDTDSNAY